MVSIEYSPNSRASCQQCRSKIDKGSIRICAKAASWWSKGDYHNSYTHAGCYTNRKDLTQLWGFHDLRDEDKKKYMTEEQKRAMFPGDYSTSVVAADGDRNTKVANGAGKSANKKPIIVTIVGLKYSEARASVGEQVWLIREPENQYDPNAVKVINANNRLVGHIQKKKSSFMSSMILRAETNLRITGYKLVTKGTVLDAGDGYKQSIRVILAKKAIGHGTVSTVAASTETGLKKRDANAGSQQDDGESSMKKFKSSNVSAVAEVDSNKLTAAARVAEEEAQDRQDNLFRQAHEELIAEEIAEQDEVLAQEERIRRDLYKTRKLLK